MAEPGESTLSKSETLETYALYKDVMQEHFRLLEYRDLLAEVAKRADKTIFQLSESLPDDFKQLLSDIEGRHSAKQRVDDRIVEFQQKLRETEDELNKLASEVASNKNSVALVSTMSEWTKLQILAQLGCVNTTDLVL